MTGKELIEKAREHEKILLNFFLGHGVNYSDAEDMVQEVYVKLWNYKERYKPTASLLTFLFLIARQVRMDSLRGHFRRVQREDKWSGERPETVSEYTSYCLNDDVCWALARLPKQMSDVIRLGVLEERPYAEIAERLNIPLGTVKSRMANALKKLKEIFDDEGS